jgi:murein DD-endopeptidase MepM/ murein hydrolase activator NlpD
MVHPDMFYSGGTLIIDHGFGVSSSFLHLSEITVKEGQNIKQGDLIAKVGKGGRASGPHLDWRMNWLDERIDPLKVIDINKDTAK